MWRYLIEKFNLKRKKPVKDILDIAGKFKAKKGQSALKARTLMEKHYKRM